MKLLSLNINLKKKKVFANFTDGTKDLVLDIKYISNIVKNIEHWPYSEDDGPLRDYLLNYVDEPEYLVSVAEAGTLTQHKVTAEDLRNNTNGYEFIYAMADMPNILDMPVGPAWCFQPNRDDMSSRGIIVRTK